MDQNCAPYVVRAITTLARHGTLKMAEYQGNKGLEYYKAYPRDFFEGAVGMDGKLRGFYRMVIDLIYLHDGFLLNDWRHISGQTGYGITQCKRMMIDLTDRDKIQVCGINGEYFEQKRAKLELSISRKFQEKQANNAAKRWNNNGLDSQVVDPTGIPPQDHKTTRLTDSTSPTHAQGNSDLSQLFANQKKPEPTKDAPKPKKTAAKAAQFPDDWMPSEKATAYCLSKGYDEKQIGQMTEDCVNHHRGKGNTFKNHDASFRMWASNQIKFHGTPDVQRQKENGNGQSNGKTSRADFDTKHREYARRLSAGEIERGPDPSDPFGGR